MSLFCLSFAYVCVCMRILRRSTYIRKNMLSFIRFYFFFPSALASYEIWQGNFITILAVRLLCTHSIQYIFIARCVRHKHGLHVCVWCFLCSSAGVDFSCIVCHPRLSSGSSDDNNDNDKCFVVMDMYICVSDFFEMVCDYPSVFYYKNTFVLRDTNFVWHVIVVVAFLRSARAACSPRRFAVRL